MMVKAGQAVDDMIRQLLPLLDGDDILITTAATPIPGHPFAGRHMLRIRGRLHISTGVSGGEEGVR